MPFLFFIVLFCEFIPKILASRFLEIREKIRPAKPILLMQRLAEPLGAMSEFLSEKIILSLIPTKKLEHNKVTSDEEFSELIDMAYQQGIIERSEREILNEIIKFSFFQLCHRYLSYS